MTNIASQPADGAEQPVALAESETVEAPSGADDEARSAAQAALVEAWCAVLDVPQAAQDDDFFSLGGHSLTAMQLIVRLNRRHGLVLSLRDVFEQRTLGAMAGQVRRTGDVIPAPSVEAAGSRPLPLSSAQRGLWFLEHLNANDASYTVPAAMTLTGPLDVEALRHAFDDVLARHDALRTRCYEGPAGPLQETPHDVALDFVICDAAGEDDALARMHAEAARPFSLGQAPLLRVRLYRLGAERHHLCLLFHHIVIDGWSFGLFCDELSAHYAAHRDGAAPDVQAPPPGYRDYTLWELAHRHGPPRAAQVDYWTRQLAGVPPLELPTDRARADRAGRRGGVARLRLDGETTQRLERFARARRATPFAVLLAAFQVLLQRHTGQTDFAVGSPSANRDAPGFEQTIGLFMNPVCLRADLSGDPTVAQCVARAARTVLDAVTHQALPFDEVVKAVGAPRVPGRNPLFQAMLVLQPALAGRLVLPGIVADDTFVHTGTSRFDLLLTLSRTAHDIDGVLEYDSDLFDARTAHRMAGQFERIVHAMLADGDARLSQIDALPAPQRQALLDTARGETRDYDLSGTLAHWMAAQAARTPHAEALTFDGRSLDYAGLDGAANALARRLCGLGVGPGSFVGVYMERSIELVIALVAVLKAGGAYVPLDPGYPAARLAFVAEDAAFPVLLTQAALAARCPPFEGKVLVVEESTNGDDAPFACPAGPDDPAYMIYTSGSTGRPKGVVVPQRGICNRLFWMQEHFALAPHDRVLQKTPYGFDVSVWEFFWPLMTGATLVMARPDGHRDSRYLRDVIAAERITTLHFVPSMLQAFLQETGIEALHSLTRVICSGEALPAPLVHRFQQRLPSAQLTNLYGPTEASVDVSWWTCPPGWSGTVVPIGRPVANTQLYVTDMHGALAPPGVPGELRIGGVQVASGYHRREALTAEKFVPDPFAAPGATLYRTGDLVRLAPDGNLWFLGRLDHQVKIRGQRVELGEIETLLAQHPRVQEAAVLAVEAGGGDHQLVGYFVSSDDESAVDDLKAFLFDALPAHMVPARFVRLDAMPLSPNGKLDRKALPLPEAPTSEQTTTLPRTPAEEAMALIWCKVLGLRQVSIDASFFELGGDSIRVLEVRNLAESHGMPFLLDSMFRHPTIRTLVEALGDASQGGHVPLPAPFQCLDAAALRHLPPGLDDAFPATQLQLGMLFHAEMEAGLPVYHDVFRYLVAGAFDAARCRAALAALAARHPALRSSFAPDRDGGYLQLVAAVCGVPLTVEDLRGCDAAAVATAAVAWTEAEKHRPFDLAQPPLLRVHVQVLDDATFALGLSFHHAILDGWSVASLVTELLQSLADAPVVPAPAASGLGAYVLLERKALAAEADRAYWQRQLAGYESPPVALSTPHGRMDDVGLVDVPLAASTLEGLQRVSRDLAAPLKSVLLAAHLVVLKSLTGSDDVLTGLVANGRPEMADSERLLGLFLNVLPFRRRIAGGSWRALVREVFAQERDAVPHRRYPLAQIQRDLRRGMLVDVVFNFVHFHVLERLSDLRPVGFDGFEMTQFPLAVNAYFDLAGAERGLRLRFVYQQQSFDAATVERLVERYAQVLASLCAAPDADIRDTELLLPDDRAALDAAARDDTPYRPGRAVHERIAAFAAAHGDALAVSDGTVSLTYAELDAAATRLAARLRSLGAGPGALVAVLLQRSPASLVALTAVLKAGAAYVPIDPAQPDARIHAIVEDAAPLCVLTDAALASRLPPGVPCVRVDETNDDAAPMPAIAASPSDAAYVVYTSGSTGVPKGVVIEHGSLCHLVDWVIAHYALTCDDRLSHVAGQGFDASVFEIWPALAAGASLHLPPDDARLAAEPLQRWLLDARITVAFAPTLLGEALAGLPWPQDTTLRALNSGGEAMRRHPAQALPFTCFNLYGPTEAAVATTAYALPASGGVAGAPPIGRPIANTRVYLVDDALRRVPPGCPGELCIAGPSVARGYLRREEITRERFVANPFGAGRLYRSGDLARLRADGELEFLGRVDGQLKLRGYRIEPGEIEAALHVAAGVAQALVAPFDRDGEKHLAAYVAMREDAVFDASALRAHLETRLPAYMVPAVFVPIARVPLTMSGKRDLAALPDPMRHFAAGTSRAAPVTPMERRLAAHWSAVLKVPAVGRDDDFFAVGGHSLAAMQLTLRLQQADALTLALRDVFEHRTLAAMASRLDGAMPQAVDEAIPHADRAALLPLSPGQASLWFLDQLEGPGATAYLVPFAFRLRGPLDTAALRAAFDEIARRHEILRTVFPAVDGAGVQRVLEPAPVAFDVVDLAAVAPEVRADAVRRHVQANAATGFDLACERPLRATLLRSGADEHVLLIALHHIVTDGWSSGVLLRELDALYGACTQGLPSPLAELPVQYADYAAWARARVDGGAIDAQVDYWRRRLAGLPVRLDLPFDRPPPALQTWRGGTVGFSLPPRSAEALRQLCRENGATLFMGALAAFGVLLARFTGEMDFAVGTPSANRGQRDVEDLIGFLANVLVMRMDLAGEPDFHAVLERVRHTALDAYDHADVPFERLVEALALEPTPAHNPLFQSMFILQNPADGELRLHGLEVAAVESTASTAKFDLTLSLEERDGGLAGAFEYNADLFDAATVERLAARFERLLDGLVAEPSAPVHRIDWLTPAERRQVLHDFNATAVDYPADRRIDVLFTEQAARTPDAVAVVFEGTTLTYAELDARAETLAAQLEALGVAREDRVALCVGRSVEMVVALLGILKAGAAYLPILPTTPRERFAWLLRDAGAKVLLTQERLLVSLPPFEGAVLCLDAGARPAVARRAAGATGNARDLAYVMHTSGSTGEPKGVMVEHRSVVRLVKNANYADFSGRQVFLSLAPLAFDASTFEIWGALLNGHALVVAPPHEHSVDEIAQLVAAHGVTTLWLTAGLFHLMVDHQLEGLGPLTQLLAGGDVLSASHVRRLKAAHPQLRLVNGYGPTENTTFTCCYEVPADFDEVSVPVGRPIANTRIHILDAYRQPVPVGVRGQLYAAGDGLARGYWNQPALTEAAFVPDPFDAGRVDADPASRLYRTGDDARWLPDGTVAFLGRRDGQVKLRGFRIELGEIEAALRRHPDVREAVVIAREDAPGDRRLVGYVVPANAAQPDAEALKAFLATRLPDYMVPWTCVVLSQLPLTTNGKVDRRALPAPQAAPRDRGAAIAPRNREEIALVQAWEDALQLQSVGVDDNFFELGGHSLTAVKAAALASQALGIAIPVRLLFRHPTPVALAQALRAEPGAERPATLVALRSRGSRTPVFCFHALFGTALFYADLARRLGDDRPVYALQTPGLYGEETPLRDLPALVERHVAEIRRTQPQGPYCLVGYCMGGVLAVEAARSLRAQGETVRLLALIDSFHAPQGIAPPPEEPEALFETFVRDLVERAGGDADTAFEEIRLLPHDARLAAAMSWASRARVLPSDVTDVSGFVPWMNASAANGALYLRHVAGIYDGDVLFLRAAQREHDAYASWSGVFAGEVSFADVPGDHATMIEAPHVDTLAAALRAVLDGTDRG